MIDALNFVRPAVTQAGLSTDYLHVTLGDGFVKSFNGSVSMYSPIDLHIEACPKAVPFMKAIGSFDPKATTTMHLTATGKLAIKSGSFRCFIDSIDDPFANVQPAGKKIKLSPKFLDAVRTLMPFVSQDSFKPWACSMLLSGNSVIATNNVIAIEYWMPKKFPVTVSLPKDTLKILLAIKEAPTHISMHSNSATFYYNSGRWVRTGVNDLDQWPRDQLLSILGKESNQAKPVAGFFEAVKSLSSFSETHMGIYLDEEGMKTSWQEGEGASVALEGLSEGRFSAVHLMLLAGIVDTIDLGAWPKPCLFFGKSVRGAIMGMH